MTNQIITAHVGAGDPGDPAETLPARLGTGALQAIAFFCSPAHDGAAIGAALQAAYPAAAVIGCTTAGEFDQGSTGTGGVAAIGFPETKVSRAVAALAPFDGAPDAGVTAAVEAIEASLGQPLRELDHNRYVGLVLIDGTHGSEERVNELLG